MSDLRNKILDLFDETAKRFFTGEEYQSEIGNIRQQISEELKTWVRTDLFILFPDIDITIVQYNPGEPLEGSVIGITEDGTHSSIEMLFYAGKKTSTIVTINYSLWGAETKKGRTHTSGYMEYGTSFELERVVNKLRQIKGDL